MKTAIQAVAESSLTARQLNSVRSLQRKVDTTPALHMRVSAAQHKAMQTAYSAVKASGLPIDPEMAKAAAQLGLK